jgi:hypothetical protein
MINAEAKCVDNALILCEDFNKQVKLIYRCSSDLSPQPTIRSSYVDIGNVELIPPEGVILDYHIATKVLALNKCDSVGLGGLICLGQSELRNVALIVKVVSLSTKLAYVNSNAKFLIYYIFI